MDQLISVFFFLTGITKVKLIIKVVNRVTFRKFYFHPTFIISRCPSKLFY